MHEDVAARLRSLARADVSMRMTRHAKEEAKKDGIVEIDILNMLTRCRVGMVEFNRGEETWRAIGTDSDNRILTAVVVADEERKLIKVITCWAGGDRS